MDERVWASIGDRGALNTELSSSLSEVWLDRDLSWLDFNERVLAEALDKRTPLLERAKFLAIFTSNLDEFFMKRVAVLRQERTAIGLVRLRELRDKLCPQLHRQAECYREVIVPALATHGIVLRSWEELTVGQREEARRYFESNISPALTPLVIDPDHPFPFLANLSTSLIFRLGEPGQTEVMHGRVKVPGDLPPWIALTADTSPGQRLFVQLCDIVRANLDRLYHGMTITATTAVRLTRDAEVDLEDDPALGLREQVEEHVRLRRYEPVVRLEFGPGADPAIREMLRERFELSPTDIYEMPGEATTPRSFRSPRCRFLSSATRRGSPFPIRRPRMSTRRSLRPSRRGTSSSIIPTTPSTPPWSASSARRPTIPRRSPSR